MRYVAPPPARARASLTPPPLRADTLLQNLQDSLSVISPELIPIHERLVNIRRQLVALAAKETAAQAAAARASAEAQPEPVIRPRAQSQAKPPDDETEMESKTPTKDSPNPEPVPVPKVKAELKPLQEELRKIDSLSVLLVLRGLPVVNILALPWVI